ncbi:IPT/TIG domain-containing protein [Fulvivirgaceae bacterium BMA10]|uniref:IPT/TIG domain-containing protein n=1 Tax=Splendidivirga corallicola TaxID=3051826 RepID=A0ABT8KKX0_9BACT|nr:IPT/TIG domain-containing protein [Fulvivirgaceae bacterium BMA10]
MKNLFTIMTLYYAFNIHSLLAQTTIAHGTEVSGTWSIAGSPYLIEGLVTIPANQTLIIDPGVEIRFLTGEDFDMGDNQIDMGMLYVKGGLIAEGTVSDRILFTRQGISGNWGCIAFHEIADPTSSLKYCKIEYANRVTGLEGVHYNGAIDSRAATIRVINSEIINNNYIGIHCENSTPIIANNVIANNINSGLYLGEEFNYRRDTIIVTNCTIINNQTGISTRWAKAKVTNTIFWDNEHSLNVSNDYLTISHSLVHEDVLPSFGTWLKIEDGMIHARNPQLEGDYSLPSFSPCIDAGSPDMVKLNLPLLDFLGENRMNLNRIDIGATEYSSTHYLSLKKPNGNEGFMGRSAQVISWASNIDNVNLEYSNDYGKSWQTIATGVENSDTYQWDIPNEESFGYVARVVSGNDPTIYDESDTPFHVITSTIPDSTFLHGRLTIEHSPYKINGIAIVPVEETLIIDPGVKLEFKTGTNFDHSSEGFDAGLLYVKGKLIAAGNSDQPIVFSRQGVFGYWGCIAFHEIADSESSLKFVEIEYANKIINLEGSYYNGAISIQNPEVSVKNSTIINNNNTGIQSENSTPIIINNIIANNAENGIFLGEEFAYNRDTINIMNNTIVNNKVGISTRWAKTKVLNTILWDNESSLNVSNDYLIISYSLVQEDLLSPFLGWLKIEDGIIYNIDPQFLNINKRDFHLELTSPCIDSGDPGTEYNLEPKPNGQQANIGAYGNTSEATFSEDIPRIRQISIKEGHIFGNDTIHIKGKGFLSSSNSSTVSFDDTPSSNYIFWSEDSIVCLTPSHLPGMVDISIKNENDKKGLALKSFLYVAPDLAQLTPAYISTGGDNQITISGTMFGSLQGNTKIYFGESKSTSYSTWTDTLISLTCPFNSEGLLDLTFEISEDLSYTIPQTLLYTTDPIVEVCNEIEGSWKPPNVYLILCDVTIPKDKTLLVQPGVKIFALGNDKKDISLTVEGKLDALGSLNDSIRFTSLPNSVGNWTGIEIKNEGNFKYVVVENAENGIELSDGTLTISDARISNNKKGIRLNGSEKQVSAVIDRSIISKNSKGIESKAHSNDRHGSVDVSINDCKIINNHDFGIRLEATGSSGFITRASSTASIIIKLDNSEIRKNGHAMEMKALGFIRDGSPFDIRRYATTRLKGNNNIIWNNEKGISMHEGEAKYSTANLDLVNTNFYHNDVHIQMLAGGLHLKNSSLWDNSASILKIIQFDTINISHSNLNTVGTAFGQNNISADPFYVSPTSGDFNLQENSPCIDSGNNLYVTSQTDLNNNIRIWNPFGTDSTLVDIGAFEFGSQKPSVPKIVNQTTQIEICEGGTFHLEIVAKDTIKPNYQWYKDNVQIAEASKAILIIENASFNDMGNYHCEVSNDYGVVISETIPVVVHLSPDKPTIIQRADTLISSSTWGNQWYLNEIPIDGATNQKYIIEKNGNYQVVVTDEQGCISQPSDISNIIYTSVGRYKLNNSIKIYPNPSHSRFKLLLKSDDKGVVQLRLYDIAGRIISNQEFQRQGRSFEYELNLVNLKSGVYLLDIVSSNEIITKRLFKL